MTTVFHCKSRRRRAEILAPSAPSYLNGLDRVEVASGGTASDGTPLSLLNAIFLRPLPTGVTPDVFMIEGGVRIRNVAPLPTTFVVSGNVVTFRTILGDRSTYRLVVKPGALDRLSPMHRLDSQFDQVEFSYHVDCPTDLDCATGSACAEAPRPSPRIDYRVRDYDGFRQLMLDRLAATLPAWQEANPADLGVTVVELLAHAADQLSYFQDAVATEAFLGTARKRSSIRRHARLLDYAMHEGCAARVWVVVEASAGDTATLPAGVQVLTRTPGYATRVPVADVDAMVERGAEVAETLHDITLRAQRNALPLYAWRDAQCCLPRGATRATLLGSFDDAGLAAGQMLLIEQTRNPLTGEAADADPALRHVVRLTSVTAEKDWLDNTQLIQVEWHPDDALPFELPLGSLTESVPSGGAPYAVARGNVVLAARGRTMPTQPLPAPRDAHEARRYRVRLPHRDLTYAEPRDPDASATRALLQDPRDARPRASLADGAGRAWEIRPDLLGSGPDDRHCVLESENDGTVFVRFGDGVHGRTAPLDVQLIARYLVGGVGQGDLGAETVAHIAPPVGPGTTDLTAFTRVTAVRNPLPASGGQLPEPIERVRADAPRAFRRPVRAVTPDDYARAAERHPDVQRAAATRRWTGSWYTTYLAVDRRGGAEVGAAFRDELLAMLDPLRMAGHDVAVEGPRYVPLDVAARVCVADGFVRGDVEAALLDAFTSGTRRDGALGFFHPDNLTFGQPVHLSRFVATAMGVRGVCRVFFDAAPGATPARQPRFRRLYGGAAVSPDVLLMGSLEIARLDNDPSAPENGRLVFIMENGL